MSAAGDPHGHHVRRPRKSGDGHVHPPDYGVRDPAPGFRGGFSEGAAACDAAVGPEGQEEGDLPAILDLLKHTRQYQACFETYRYAVPVFVKSMAVGLEHTSMLGRVQNGRQAAKHASKHTSTLISYRYQV